jgi:hypothetical protein
MHRYNVSVSDVFSGAFATSMQAFVRNSRDSSLLATIDLLVEALKLRDGMLYLPNSQLSLTKDDIINFIALISAFFFVFIFLYHVLRARHYNK